MKRRVCGGCEGRGSHWRWCPNAVGASASARGQWADMAEALGDSVGPNNYGASNHLWAAAALLREDASALAAEWQKAHRDGRPDGR